MKLKLTKFQAEWLAFVVETEGHSSPQAFLRQTILQMAEAENAHCEDPENSKFRAWKLERDGYAYNRTCTGSGACKPCVEKAAEVGVKLPPYDWRKEAERRRRETGCHPRTGRPLRGVHAAA